jgi:hypothetical protein
MKTGDPTSTIALDMWVNIRGVIVRHSRDRKRAWARELHFDREYNALCVKYAHKTCSACPARCHNLLDEFRHVLEDFLYSRAETADLLRAVDAMINLFTALVYHGPTTLVVNERTEPLKNEEVQEVIATSRRSVRTGCLDAAV